MTTAWTLPSTPHHELGELAEEKVKAQLERESSGEAGDQGSGGAQPSHVPPQGASGAAPPLLPLTSVGPREAARGLVSGVPLRIGDSEQPHPCPAQPSPALPACFCLIGRLGHPAQRTNHLQVSPAGLKAQASWALSRQDGGLSGHGGCEFWNLLDRCVERTQLWRPCTL